MAVFIVTAGVTQGADQLMLPSSPQRLMLPALNYHDGQCLTHHAQRHNAPAVRYQQRQNDPTCPRVDFVCSQTRCIRK